MADREACIETADGDVGAGQETRAGLLARIERLKAALAESRVGQTCRQVGTQVDESVHTKPYHYIAGAAVVGLLAGVVAGLLIGHRHD